MYFEPLAGTDSLTMRISDGSGRFRMTWGCGGEGEEGSRSEVLSLRSGNPAMRVRPDRRQGPAARIEKMFRREQ